MQGRNLYGEVDIEPKKDVVAGSMVSLKITLTVGKYGVDDGGSIIIVRKSICDEETPQFTDPQASGYTTASTTGEVKLKLSFDHRYFYRPWFKALCIKVYDGSLKEGDKVFITLGDRSRGGPGFRAQTFQEKEHLYKVLVDPFGTRRYFEVESPPRISVVGGPPKELQVVAPSIVTPNEKFIVTVRALDSWGNPSPTYRGELHFKVVDSFDSLPCSCIFNGEEGGIKRLEGVSLRRPGLYRIEARDSLGLKAVSNPIMCLDRGELKLYWGDLHGQTHGKARGVFTDTVGTGTPREYFEFARDVASIDFCSWQGNDFQVYNDLWEDVCVETKAFNQPGRFVTFLGYEWSGLTPNGGDHNILYLKDDQPIYRSSHGLIMDESDVETDRCPVSKLWDTFRGREDVMAIPHVGGRYANLGFFDPEIIRLIEIHSFHGTFEWFAREALGRGLKVGFVSCSDDHTCRPGLAYPPYVRDKVKGGLTAVYATDLTRESLWDSLKMRRCYGTTGARIILLVDIDGHMMGEEFSTDRYPKINVEVHGTDLINRVQVYRGLNTIYSFPPPAKRGGGDKAIQVIWSGSRSKGRNKRTVWDGILSLSSGRIVWYEAFAFKRGVDLIEEVSNQFLKWRSSTVGDYKGLFLKLDAPDETEILFKSEPKSFTFQLKDLRDKSIVIDAGGVDQKIEVGEIRLEDRSMDMKFVYVDKGVKVGVNPYWIFVQQVDGEMAWSSPIYVDYKK